MQLNIVRKAGYTFCIFHGVVVLRACHGFPPWFADGRALIDWVFLYLRPNSWTRIITSITPPWNSSAFCFSFPGNNVSQRFLAGLQFGRLFYRRLLFFLLISGIFYGGDIYIVTMWRSHLPFCWRQRNSVIVMEKVNFFRGFDVLITCFGFWPGPRLSCRRNMCGCHPSALIDRQVNVLATTVSGVLSRCLVVPAHAHLLYP